MGIPIGLTYESRVEGQIIKSVTCSGCSCEFIYLMKRSGTGAGTSLLWLDNHGAKARAASSAERVLESQLQKDCDPVPCPDCGIYQKNMVFRMKFYRSAIFFFSYIVLAVAAAIYLASTPDAFPSIRTYAADHFEETLIGALAGLFAGVVLIWLISPNRNAHRRICREYTDKSRSIRKADFEALQARQNEQKSA